MTSRQRRLVAIAGSGPLFAMSGAGFLVLALSLLFSQEIISVMSFFVMLLLSTLILCSGIAGAGLISLLSLHPTRPPP
jgi:hypothetical protein